MAKIDYCQHSVNFFVCWEKIRKMAGKDTFSSVAIAASNYRDFQRSFANKGLKAE